jgi:hypothetical protein
MTFRDTVVDEVRKTRENYAQKFDFDIDAICADLQQKERVGHAKTVMLPKKPARPAIMRP